MNTAKGTEFMKWCEECEAYTVDYNHGECVVCGTKR